MDNEENKLEVENVVELNSGPATTVTSPVRLKGEMDRTKFEKLRDWWNSPPDPQDDVRWSNDHPFFPHMDEILELAEETVHRRMDTRWGYARDREQERFKGLSQTPESALEEARLEHPDSAVFIIEATARTARSYLNPEKIVDMILEQAECDAEDDMGDAAGDLFEMNDQGRPVLQGRLEQVLDDWAKTFIGPRAVFVARRAWYVNAGESWDQARERKPENL